MMDELWQREQKQKTITEKEEFLNEVVPLLKPLGLFLPSLLIEQFFSTPITKDKQKKN